MMMMMMMMMMMIYFITGSGFLPTLFVLVISRRCALLGNKVAEGKPQAFTRCRKEGPQCRAVQCLSVLAVLTKPETLIMMSFEP
jgi:hypothetical protein